MDGPTHRSLPLCSRRRVRHAGAQLSPLPLNILWSSLPPTRPHMAAHCRHLTSWPRRECCRMGCSRQLSARQALTGSIVIRADRTKKTVNATLPVVVLGSSPATLAPTSLTATKTSPSRVAGYRSARTTKPSTLVNGTSTAAAIGRATPAADAAQDSTTAGDSSGAAAAAPSGGSMARASTMKT